MYHRVLGLSIAAFALITSFTATAQQNTAAPAEGCAWKKQVSRIIDFGRKADTVAHHKKPVRKDVTLVELLVNEVKAGRLTAYSNYEPPFTARLTVVELNEIIARRDIQTITDPVTGKETTKDISYALDFEGVHQYRLLENWTIDPATGKTEIQITGIAPIRDVYGDDGTFRGVQGIFWLHYNEAKPIVEKYERSHPDKSISRKIWQDYFSASAPATSDGPMQCIASRTVSPPKDKAEDDHHLRDEGDLNTLPEELTSAKYEGKIATYSGYNHGFAVILPANEFIDHESGKTVHTQVITDPVTGQEVEKTITSIHNSNDSRFKTMEQWSFDPGSGKTVITILGIAPVEERTINNVPKLEPQYWMQYKDISDRVYRYVMSHPKNNFYTALWDSYFSSDVRPDVVE
jgi:hypothetical protein